MLLPSALTVHGFTGVAPLLVWRLQPCSVDKDSLHHAVSLPPEGHSHVGSPARYKTHSVSFAARTVCPLLPLN